MDSVLLPFPTTHNVSCLSTQQKRFVCLHFLSFFFHLHTFFWGVGNFRMETAGHGGCIVAVSIKV